MPKNYSGVAFRDKEKIPLPHLPEEHVTKEPPCLPPPPEMPSEKPKREEKNPLSSILKIFSGREKSGFDAEDFLLIGLIALLLGKEGNEDIVLILAMLLLI